MATVLFSLTSLGKHSRLQNLIRFASNIFWLYVLLSYGRHMYVSNMKYIFALYTSWGVIWDWMLCSRTKGWPTRFFHLAFTADTKYFSYMFQVLFVFFLSLWTFIYLCIYWLSHQCLDKWGVSKVGWFNYQSEASVFDNLVINLKICLISMSSVYHTLISWSFFFFWEEDLCW